MSNRQALLSKLAKARQQLKKAQARMAALERQLAKHQPIPRVSEERYHHLFDNMLEGCQIIGFDWRYLYVNEAATRHGQRTKEELLGYTMLERYPGIEQTPMFTILQRCMQERTVANLENEFIYPNGASAWFELRVQPVLEGLFILSLDITARKQAEERSHRSEEQFHILVDGVKDSAIYLLDTKGYVVSWNTGAERIKGYQSDEIIGQSYSRFFIPADQQEGKPQRLLTSAKTQGWIEDEGWRVRKDGSLFWANVGITALWNLDGSPYGFAKITRDLTQRKQAEEHIRKLNRTLAVLGDINQSIARCQHIPDLFEKACTIAVERGAFRMAWIGRVDPQTGRVTPIAQAGIADGYLGTVDIHLCDGLEAQDPLINTLRSGMHWVCHDFQSELSILPWRQAASQLGCRSFIVLPLLVAGQVYGTFALYADEPNFFDAEEIRLLDEIAGDISFALEIAKQEEERQTAETAIKRYAQRLEILHELDLGLIRANSIQALVQATLQHMRVLIPCQQVCVSLFEQTSNEILILASDANPASSLLAGKRYPMPPGFLEGFGDSTVSVIDDIQSHPELSPIHKRCIAEGMRSFLHVLLMAPEGPMGVLSLNATIPSFFTAEHQEIVLQIANQLAIAIRQHKLAANLANYAAELEQNNRDLQRLQVAQKQQIEVIEEMQQFLQSTLDAFPANAAVLDPAGTIININAPWKTFAEDNDAPSANHYLGANYLQVCDTAADDGAKEALLVAQGIRAVIADAQDTFYLEYPCHSATEKRWFGLRVTPFSEPAPRRVVVSHLNILERKRAEEALQASHRTLEQRVIQRTAELQAAKEHVEAILNNSVDGILLIEPDFSVQQTNAAFDHLFGCAPHEVFNQSLLKFIHREDTDTISQIIHTVVAEQQEKRAEVRAKRQDGTVFDAELSIGLIKNDGLVCIIHDISERKAYERQLRYHASLQETVSDAVIVTDKDFCIQSWNRAAEHIYGWRAEEVIGQATSTILQTQFLSDGERAHSVQQLLEQGWWQGEIIQQHKDGTLRHILESLTLLRDEQGKPFGVVAVNHDITERKRAEEALTTSEVRYRLLAEHITDVVMRLNTSIELIYISPSSRTILGYEPAELIGQSVFTYIHPDDLIATEQALAKAIQQSPQVISLVARVRHKQGHYVWLEAAGQVVLSEKTGDSEGFVASARDITERKRAEESLRESEEKFRLLLNAAPIATIITDSMGHITLVNIQAEILFGFHRTELVGQLVEILLPEYARGLHVHNRQTYIAAPHARRMGSGLELFARHKDGHEFPVEIELGYIETKDDVMVMSFVVDIRERKQIAAELERQRSFLRNVIDVSPNLVFVKDYDARFVLVNPMVAKIYNTTVEAMIGKTDADFNPSPPEVNHFLAADRRVIDTGIPLSLEEPITNSVDETHWLHTTKVPIISADGKSKYVLGVATDITERIRAEVALKASEEKYRQLVETMQGGLAVYDVEGRITYVNDRFCELLGYSRKELIGTRSAEYAAETDTHKLETQSSENFTYEMVVRHKTGRFVHLLVSGSLLFDKNSAYNGSFTVATDITTQKQAEEALRQTLIKEKELSELKSRFVSMASHEFRTPLATILALTETLSAYRHKLSEALIEEQLEKIKGQIAHLKNIMEDVLLLAQMQARRVVFNPVILDLDDLCRSVLAEFRGRTDVSHRLNYQCSEGFHPVKLDPKLMRQILSNLVSNAIKYSSKDKAIEVNLVFMPKSLILQVRDEGIGIPEADLKHLFEPFHRAANVGAISGTGLGLVITKEAVELHSGTITVESQLERGTTITIRLPITIS